MSRRTLIAAAVILLGGLGLLWWLQGHSVDLVHSVVLNAMVQKLPEDYPASTVEGVFRETRQRALRQGREDRYLEALVLVSQRLEKRQRFQSWEVEEALDLLREFDEGW